MFAAVEITSVNEPSTQRQSGPETPAWQPEAMVHGPIRRCAPSPSTYDWLSEPMRCDRLRREEYVVDQLSQEGLLPDLPVSSGPGEDHAGTVANSEPALF